MERAAKDTKKPRDQQILDYDEQRKNRIKEATDGTDHLDGDKFTLCNRGFDEPYWKNSVKLPPV